MNCFECGRECDGTYRDMFNEPLCSECAEVLGYKDLDDFMEIDEVI